MQTQLKSLDDVASRQDWEGIEEAWMALFEGQPPRTTSLRRAIDTLRSAGQEKRLTALLEIASNAYADAGRPADVLEILRHEAELRPEDQALRERALELYREINGGRDGLEEILERGQRNAPAGARPLLETLDLLLAFHPGSFVEDPKGWGFGKVTEVDLRRMEITVDFEEQKNHVIPLDSAVEFLRPVDAEQFECKMLDDKEGLIREAKEDPAGLIRRFLKSHGIPAPLRVIRAAVADVLVPAKEWSKLWNKAKKELVHDPHVEISPGSQPTLSLRDIAITREDEIAHSVRTVRKARDVMKIVREYLAEPASEGRADFLGKLHEQLAELAEKQRQKEPGLHVELLYLLRQVDGAAQGLEGMAAPTEELAGLLDDTFHLCERVASMQTREYATQFVRDVIARKPEGWEEAVASLLATPGVHPSVRELANRACKDGVARGHRNEALRKVLGDPRGLPEPFFWVSMRTFAGKLDISEITEVSMLDLFERHVDLVGALGAQTAYDGASARKTMTREARKAVTEDLIRQLLGDAGASGARRLALAIARNNELDVTFKALARSTIGETYPEAVEALAEPEDDKDVIWTSPAGLRKRQKDYDHLINVEIKANGVALGKARELGDLSENAEWDAAREEERRLIGKQKQMSDELEKAKVIEFGTGEAARVEPGVAVRARRLDGAGGEFSYTLLGPWDVDPDRGIISYMSPLGLGLLGHSKNDVVDVKLPSGEQARYEVLETVWATPPEPVG